MPQSLICFHAHTIFSTKNRAPMITPDLQPRLYDYIGGIVQAQKNCLIAAGGMPDHVHLLVSLARDASIADTIRLIKSNSSKWIHDTFSRLHDFAWQSGYGAFAVSFSNIGAVKHYLATQEQHHRQRSFQDEYREFLRVHEIPFDERYVWD